MLQTYSTGLAVTPGQLIPFNVNALQTGCIIKHGAGGVTVSFGKSGVYHVTLTIVGAPTDAGDIGAQINVNGVALPQGQAASTAAAGATTTVVVDTLVNVPMSCACIDNSVSLSVQYTGVAGTLTLANLTVMKVK